MDIRHNWKVAMLLCWVFAPGSGTFRVDRTGKAFAKNITQHIPPYHSSAAEKRLPKTLSPEMFAGDRIVESAYSVAAKIRPVLYQLPCYCGCAATDHHKCLLDCFVGTHASACDICLKEVFYAYAEINKGRSVKYIRDRIIRGDWTRVRVTDIKLPDRERTSHGRLPSHSKAH